MQINQSLIIYFLLAIILFLALVIVFILRNKKGNSFLIEKELKEIKENINNNYEKSLASEKNQIENFFKNQAELQEKLSSFRLLNQESMNISFDRIRNENNSFFEEINKNLIGLSSVVDKQLNSLKEENSKKLEEIKLVVDEKLQSTLEERITRSFKEVKENLERLYTSLGALNTLTSDVRNINKIFSNVKARGIWGEVQAESILSDVLTQNQYVKDYSPRMNREKVEFAVKLPGKNGKEGVYLPIDSKFPLSDYQNYKESVESHDDKRIEDALKALKKRVLQEAKDINSKYIVPPYTTDFALLFIPSESLYAELQAMGDLTEELQNKERVILSSPNNLAALLSSLSLGFKTLQIEMYASKIYHGFEVLKEQFKELAKSIDESKTALESANKKLESAKDKKDKINVALDKLIFESKERIELEE